MRIHIRTWVATVVLACSGIAWAQGTSTSTSARADSPDGKVRIELFLPQDGAGAERPHWRAFFQGRPVLLDSSLGLDLGEGQTIGGPCIIESVQSHPHREEYVVPVGKRRRIVDQCTETVVALRERGAPGRRWEIVLRAYDYGVAFRYRFPAQANWPKLVIAEERTEFAFPDDAQAYALPLNSFTTSFEGRYERKRVQEVPRNWLIGLPLLVECPGVGWAAVTEANLTDYSGMYLTREGASSGSRATSDAATLVSRLSPLPRDPKTVVRASLPHDSPWRVVMMGSSPGALIESDLIFDLNEPCAIADTSWIHTGKTTFPWWNDYYLEHVPFQPGQNTATLKHYIDFCAEAGIPYHSLDGYQNIGWYGCQIGPHTPADITKAIPEIDLPDVLRYAKSKGIGIRLWLHWEDVTGHIDQAFPLYRSWGISGVMLDFMNRDDQEMQNFLREVIVKAAENHLTVTFHGVSKPTGLERTYPNLLNSESVLNLEYDKWDKLGCPPEHELTVVFTRMLAGPMDFHQGSLRGVPVEQFRPRNTAPLVMGTPTHMLATYVVFENHLPMVADYPAAYRGNPLLPILAQIPATWDDTKVLAGEVGQYIVVARRKGDAWYIGAMNAKPARELDVPLRFIGGGQYEAEIYADDPTWPATHGAAQRTEQVTSADVLKVKMVPAGGYVARLTPVNGSKPKTAK